MKFAQLTDFPIGLKDVLELSSTGVKITNEKVFRSEIIDELVNSAVLAADEDVRDAARWIIWEAANELGAYSSSIQDLYVVRGKDEYKDVCVPAVNIRGITYDSARAMFRAIAKVNAGPAIFEIAKSEIGYTFQRPAEYVAAVLAAAIKEGYKGPVCIQGDHFQVGLKGYNEDGTKEVQGVKDLIVEAIEGGFYNIDIDTSTLVDLDQPTVKEQQRLNYEIGAELAKHIRDHEPEGVTVSIGGEIGEVGGKNSNVEELEAYVEGFNETLEKIAPGKLGISKISVQTGTSHGGVPLPDGSVAEVALDFSVLEELGKVSRDKYAISGTVQHGASTLPDEAFHRFKECQASEVHLATGFQNLVMDHPKFPAELRDRIYAWLNVNCAKEKKDDQTQEQFFYKTRKKGFGPFKAESWQLDDATMSAIMGDLEAKFVFLFEQIGLTDSKKLADTLIQKVFVKKAVPAKFKALLDDPLAFGMAHGAEEDAPGAD